MTFYTIYDLRTPRTAVTTRNDNIVKNYYRCDVNVFHFERFPKIWRHHSCVSLLANVKKLNSSQFFFRSYCCLINKWSSAKVQFTVLWTTSNKHFIITFRNYQIHYRLKFVGIFVFMCKTLYIIVSRDLRASGRK